MRALVFSNRNGGEGTARFYSAQMTMFRAPITVRAELTRATVEQCHVATSNEIFQIQIVFVRT